MTHPLFTSSFDDLPETLPVFPLSGAIVLPRQMLPLNIFEPRYLNMTLDALGADRMIGMIQPLATAAAPPEPELYTVGCAGRITAFQETDDGRLLINLTGVCRFDVERELEPHNGYRRVRLRWTRFRDDLSEPQPVGRNLDTFDDVLRSYLAAQSIEVDWEVLHKLPAERLIDFLAVNLPLEAEEKQALVEATDPSARSVVLEAALTMAARGTSTASASTRH